jgi:hypothetical protein
LDCENSRVVFYETVRFFLPTEGGIEWAASPSQFCGAAEGAGNVALHPSASFAAITVGDHGLRNRNQCAGADTLHDAKCDQRNHIPRQSAQCGANKEDADPEQQHRLSAVEVGQTTVNRNQYCLRQQVSAENPAEEVNVAEEAHNCGEWRSQQLFLQWLP